VKYLTLETIGIINMANFFGKIFNKQAEPEVQETSNDSAPAASDGLTGVAKYLQQQQQQPAESSTATQQTDTSTATQTQQVATPQATGVAKYVDSAKTPSLTGVTKYLVKQIIPEYKIKAAAASKAAAPTGVEKYLTVVAAKMSDAQPSVPTGVEIYVTKLTG
jgi:hypothetical protein